MAMLGMEQVNFPARISPVASELSVIQITEPTARSLGLREGQVVQALVETRGDTMALNVAGRTFNLAGHAGLQATDAIWVRFVSFAGKPALQVLGPVVPGAAGPGAVGATTASAQAAQAQAAQAQAAQAALAPLGALGAMGAGGVGGLTGAVDGAFAALSSTVLALLGRPAGLPALTRLMHPGVLNAAVAEADAPELAQALAALRPSASGLNAEALRQALAHSGLWTEAWLARGKSVGSGDSQKVFLRQLIQTLGRSSESAALAQEAVEEIERSQIESVQAAAQREFMFSFVLPFRDSEPVVLRFLRQARQGPEEPPWTVEVHTQSSELGEVWLKTTVSDQTRIDLTMWALRHEVVREAQRRAADLQDELEFSGLSLNSFQVLQAHPPADSRGAVGSAGGLVDARA